jgi:hypothetical protein
MMTPKPRSSACSVSGADERRALIIDADSISLFAAIVAPARTARSRAGEADPDRPARILSVQWQGYKFAAL